MSSSWILKNLLHGISQKIPQVLMCLLSAEEVDRIELVDVGDIQIHPLLVWRINSGDGGSGGGAGSTASDCGSEDGGDSGSDGDDGEDVKDNTGAVAKGQQPKRSAMMVMTCSVVGEVDPVVIVITVVEPILPRMRKPILGEQTKNHE